MSNTHYTYSCSYRCSWMLFFALIFPLFAIGQSKEVLTLDQYIQQVKNYHPVINKSSLLVDQSYAQELQAKALFDPQVMMDSDRKELASKKYFDYQNYGVEMATRSPVMIKAGHDKVDGSFTNPELTTGGITYLGIELPLLNGFLMDQRRAALAQSRLFVSQSKAAKQAMINDLLLDAHIAYWQWASAYQQYDMLEQFLQNAQQRLGLMKDLFVNGDRAVADTVEASVQLDYVRLQALEAKMQLVNETFNLSSFLWNSNNLAYIVDEKYIPDTISFNGLTTTTEWTNENNSIANNPSLRLYDFKLSALQIDRKLKSQYLLPKFDLKASLLRRNNDFPLNADNFQSLDNYKIGFSVKYPLFARSARAQLEENKIKSSMVRLDLEQQKWEYNIKLKTLTNEYLTLKNQWTTNNGIIEKNTALRDLENLKLSIGESTLFLINIRENKMIESFTKRIDLTLKIYKTKSKMQWISGVWVQ